MIDKIGIEYEAGFKKEGIDKLNKIKHLDIKQDGSVRTKEENLSQEITTKPFKFKDLEKLKEVVCLLADNTTEINETMGFHIHLSFTDYSDYVKLFKYDFVKRFTEEYAEKFTTTEELKRLDNQYSQQYKNNTDFFNTALSQVSYMGKGGSRYRAVNFNAYNLYNTIEFRIFGMNKKDKLIEYIDFLINSVNSFLENAEEVKLSYEVAVKYNPKSKVIKYNKVVEI